jgi:hypothetical protein
MPVGETICHSLNFVLFIASSVNWSTSAQLGFSCSKRPDKRATGQQVTDWNQKWHQIRRSCHRSTLETKAKKDYPSQRIVNRGPAKFDLSKLDSTEYDHTQPVNPYVYLDIGANFNFSYCYVDVKLSIGHCGRN